MALAANVDCFVDPGRSEEHDNALEAILVPLENGSASLKEIVACLGPCLTTMDDTVRSRGVLLLGKLLEKSKAPLDQQVARFMVEYMLARLEDLPCFHGALISCLALLRKSGAVPAQDVWKILEIVSKDALVQSLSQKNRMLCLEIVDYILENNFSAVAFRGPDLLTSVRLCIEGEKDPRCLLIVFRLVERLLRLLPNANLGSRLLEEAFDLFDILSCYFPISFKEKPGESIKEQLLTSLQTALAASSLVASECIGFLLEKISSTLQDAKLQALSTLSVCVAAYGVEAVSPLAGAVWEGLKAELLQETEDIKVFNAAKDCLTKCIRAFQPDEDREGYLLPLILEDKIYADFMAHNVELDRTRVEILSAAARASRGSSKLISSTILKRVIQNLKAETETSNLVKLMEALVAILAAVREVAERYALECEVYDSTWLQSIYSSKNDLLKIYLRQAHDAEAFTQSQLFQASVVCLQLLATFPGYLSALPAAEANELVVSLMNMIYVDSNSSKQAALSVAAICETEERHAALGRSATILQVVVPRLLQLVTQSGSHASDMVVFAVTAISRSSFTARNVLLNTLIESLESIQHENILTVLKCLSEVLLPLCDSTGPCLAAAMTVWHLVESFPAGITVGNETLMALMEVVRAAVSRCDGSQQEIILGKALDSIHQQHSCKQPWLVPLFSSVVVASQQHIQLQDREILDMLYDGALEETTPEISEAITESLASIVNKWSPQPELDSTIIYLFDKEQVLKLRNPHGICSQGAVRVVIWITKALAMRGDPKVAEVAAILLRLLVVDEIASDTRATTARGLGIIVGEARGLNKQHFATEKVLYKQKLFCSLLSPLREALKDAKTSRIWVIRGFSYMVAANPQVALASSPEIVFPLLLEAISALASDPQDVLILNSSLLTLSSFLTSEQHKVVADHITTVVNNLVELTQYPHSWTIRQTSIRCLCAVLAQPFSSIYPLKQQVIKALTRALDDRKRAVRLEAVQCYKTWVSA